MRRTIKMQGIKISALRELIIIGLIKNHAIIKNMTLYKHVVYVDFVSFTRQSWNCYLKDTCEFFPTLNLAKNNQWIGYTLHPKEELGFPWGTGSPPYYTEMLVFKHSDFISGKQNISCSKDWFLSIGRHLLLNLLFQKD